MDCLQGMQGAWVTVTPSAFAEASRYPVSQKMYSTNYAIRKV